MSLQQSPRRVVVVGAGVVGLSCAWYLARRGIEVVVLERSAIGAGASWGNAGWLSPGLAVPLPEPALVREGLRGLADPYSPLTIDPRMSGQTAAFLTGFARNATAHRWHRGLTSLGRLNRLSLAAFDEMATAGVPLVTHEADILIGFRPGDKTGGLRHELDSVRKTGQKVDYVDKTPEPPFSSRIDRAIILSGQRYTDPGQVLESLAAGVRAAGGSILEGVSVRAIEYGPKGLQAATWTGTPVPADAVVLATGAWLPELARPLGVRIPVQAGRGYSCTVRMATPLATPVYLPGVRVAITPYRDGARLAGTMEIAHRDAPFKRGRLEAISRSVRPLLDGVDWTDIRDPWVGPRPLTTDGLPLIGETGLPGVHIAGGHGMWGLTLGPVTGKLLAEQIMTGSSVPQLAAFDPTR